MPDFDNKLTGKIEVVDSNGAPVSQSFVSNDDDTLVGILHSHSNLLFLDSVTLETLEDWERIRSSAVNTYSKSKAVLSQIENINNRLDTILSEFDTDLTLPEKWHKVIQIFNECAKAVTEKQAEFGCNDPVTSLTNLSCKVYNLEAYSETNEYGGRVGRFDFLGADSFLSMFPLGEYPLKENYPTAYSYILAQLDFLYSLKWQLRRSVYNLRSANNTLSPLYKWRGGSLYPYVLVPPSTNLNYKDVLRLEQYPDMIRHLFTLRVVTDYDGGVDYIDPDGKVVKGIPYIYWGDALDFQIEVVGGEPPYKFSKSQHPFGWLPLIVSESGKLTLPSDESYWRTSGNVPASLGSYNHQRFQITDNSGWYIETSFNVQVVPKPLKGYIIHNERYYDGTDWYMEVIFPTYPWIKYDDDGKLVEGVGYISEQKTFSYDAAPASKYIYAKQSLLKVSGSGRTGLGYGFRGENDLRPSIRSKPIYFQWHNATITSDLEYLDKLYYTGFPFSADAEATVFMPVYNGTDKPDAVIVPIKVTYGANRTETWEESAEARTSAITTTAYADIDTTKLTEYGVPSRVYEKYSTHSYHSFTIYPSEIVASGTCGENVKWKLNDKGILAIRGDGAIDDYTVGSAPWYGHASEIERIIIMDGVTTIGSYAFYGLNNLFKVEFYADLTEIKDNAFADSVMTLARYRSTIEDWNNITIGTGNDCLLNAKLGTHLSPQTSGVIECQSTDPQQQLSASRKPVRTSTIAWNFDAEAETLTISGEAWIDLDYFDTRPSDSMMYDFSPNPPSTPRRYKLYCGKRNIPWEHLAIRVKHIIIEGDNLVGLAGLGSMFYNVESIVFPSGVKYINNLCNGMANLTKVDLSNNILNSSGYILNTSGLTGNCGYAFSDCSKLNYVILKKDFVIYPYMFHRCYSLQRVENLDKAYYIYKYAFTGCASLYSVTLGKLSQLEPYAFFGAGVKEVTIKGFSGKYSLKGNPFISCRNLERITIIDDPETANAWVDDYGALYGYATVKGSSPSEYVKALYTYPYAKKMDTYYVAEDTEVINGAFYYAESVNTVVINEGCKRVEDYTFSDSKIKKICISSTVGYFGYMGSITDGLEIVALNPGMTYHTNIFNMDSSRLITFYGYKGSTTETLASKYSNWTFVALDEEPSE